MKTRQNLCIYQTTFYSLPIQIDQSSLGLPSRDYFLKEDSNAIINEYKTFIQTIVKELGSSHDEITDEVNNLVDFETTIAQVKTGMIKVGMIDSNFMNLRFCFPLAFECIKIISGWLLWLMLMPINIQLQRGILGYPSIQGLEFQY